MPIRYMGTKRHLAHHVRELVEGHVSRGPVCDLFSGTGAVAESLAGTRSVVTNDAHAFTAALARARFTGPRRQRSAGDVVEDLKGRYRERLNTLTRRHRDQLLLEAQALEGDSGELAGYMGQVEHVGNSSSVAARAARAAKSESAERYCMATLYFAGGYFGLRQAIQLDAMRYAIDSHTTPDERDWLVASWLTAASVIANAPGHTAQYLKPSTDNAASRIRRYWRRSAWDEFQNALCHMQPVGTARWRSRNRVVVSEALKLLGSPDLGRVGAVYADPPYTKDQYSRFYHVYETLFLYDFPGAFGQGRTRPDRFTTGFSLKSGVVEAFETLFCSAAELDVPLILSYPSSGLLSAAGLDVLDAAGNYMKLTKHQKFEREHSTMGASSGAKTKSATENLYVFQPA